MGCRRPPHRPSRCQWRRPRISMTWSWQTCGAMWQARTAALRTLRPPQPVAETVGGTTAAPQALPLRAAEPRDDRRPLAPAQAPRRPPEPVHGRPPPPPWGGTVGVTGAGLLIVPADMMMRRTAKSTVLRSNMAYRIGEAHLR